MWTPSATDAEATPPPEGFGPRVGELSSGPLDSNSQFKLAPLSIESLESPTCRQLHHYFERAHDRDPAARAIECGSAEILSYADVEQQANCLARELRARGIGRGHLVGVWLPRSARMHVVLLGILKAGAAYLPLDPDYPADRVEYILADANAVLLITQQATAEQLQRAADPASQMPLPPLLAIDEAWQRIQQWPSERLTIETNTSLASGGSPSASLPIDDAGDSAADLAYVIYTSGSTGRPKGVMIEHRQITALVEAERRLYGVEPRDRVYQGFSIAFDASLEEIWLAFAAGATLIVGDQQTIHLGPELTDWLIDRGVTVLSCVPTLLSMLERDVPGLRILILGGEACPRSLLARWRRPGRKLFNTYGPTEATVIATAQEVLADEPVTIGRPIHGYEAVVVDEQAQPLPVGVAGELLLGGAGIARGYLGRPELTAEKFLSDPFQTGMLPAPRWYRTGDLCRLTDSGEIEFLGRIDGQVKLRGFRVELAEVEAVLLECPGVKAAACAVHDDAAGIAELVGYVVPLPEAHLSAAELRSHLQTRLPPYMVPAVIEYMTSFPTLTSGKVDRRQLPPPAARPVTARKLAIEDEPVDETERQLLAAWEIVFPGQVIGRHDNFFLDLGGHSLLAARVVSRLRHQPGFAGVSMLDLYQWPTVAQFAEGLEARRQAATSTADAAAKGTSSAEPVVLPFQPWAGTQASATRRSWRFFWCGVGQFFCLYPILALISLQWLGPYMAFTYLNETELSWLLGGNQFRVEEALLGGALATIAVYPLMMFVAVSAKWVLLGRIRPGVHPLWGSYYFRWWLVDSLVSLVPVRYLAGTPLLNLFLRLMGARIGVNTTINTDHFAAYDLLSIGDDTCIGGDATLLGYTVEDGLLKLGPVTIGNRCFVGNRCVLREGAGIEDDGRLGDLSQLVPGQTIPAGETWAGSPAARVDQLPDDFHRPPLTSRPSLARRFGFGLLHALGVCVFPLLVVVALMPGVALMNELNYADDYYWYLVWSPLVALSFVLLLCLEIAAIKWLLLGRIRPGTYPVHSTFYVRKWMIDRLLELSLDVIGPVYSTLYLAPWYRMLGARVGRRAEISTASFISPDLLTLGDESFIADVASLGSARLDRQVITLGSVVIGRRSFIGNSGLLPHGTVVGDEALIGCLSLPPAANMLKAETSPLYEVPDHTSWLGSPPLRLPARQQSVNFSVEQTYQPPARLYAVRLAIEALRILLPSTGFIIVTSLLMSAVVLMIDELHHWQVETPYNELLLLLMFPLKYGAMAVVAALAVVALKWLVMGRYRPQERPLWSPFVWRTEMITGSYEYLAKPLLIGALAGTPFLAWYLRLLGARIGKRVYLNSTEITEFDLVDIGDDAAINFDATLQTHLFEDRVMKMSTVRIGERASVGSDSLVLYDTEIGAGAKLGDLSLLMKGEVLPPETAWVGIPARRS